MMWSDTEVMEETLFLISITQEKFLGSSGAFNAAEAPTWKYNVKLQLLLLILYYMPIY